MSNNFSKSGGGGLIFAWVAVLASPIAWAKNAAPLIIVILVSMYVLCLSTRHSFRSKSYKGAVVALCVAYLGSVTLFGSIYNLVEFISPGSFSFPEHMKQDIAKYQYELTEGRYERDREKQLFLTKVVDSITELPELGCDDYRKISNEYSAKLCVTPSSRPDEYILTFRNDTKGTHFDYGGGLPSYGETEVSFVIEITRLDSNQDRFETLKQLNEFLTRNLIDFSKMRIGYNSGIPEWRLIDFTYFSAVTSTTLGYGDIIPANSLARLLIMLQTITSVLFLTTFLYVRNE